MKLKNREKWVVGAGILIALFIGIYSIVAEPLFNQQINIRKEIDKKSYLIGHYRSLLSKKDIVDEELEILKQKGEQLDKHLLKAGSPSIAAAELQKFLHENAKRLNISIVSEKVDDPAQNDIFTVIPVELVVKSNLRKLITFIYSVENSEKYIKINRIRIKIKRQVSELEEEVIETKIETQGFFI